MKHSPSPWIYKRALKTIVSKNTGFRVCVLQGTLKYRDANGRLIECATKLLHCLEDLLSKTENDLDTKYREKILRLIAKAKGIS